MTSSNKTAARSSSFLARVMTCARNEKLQAALILLLQIAAFLWIPLSRYNEVHYSAADLTQAFSLTRIEPGHLPGNQLQSDAVTQMQPWTMLNKEEALEGRLPLWNRWNGAGCPHLANYQSAVFSPFRLPYLIADFKTGLLLAAALKLFALGFFTYLFLREIHARHLAALVGATIFTFAGHNTLLNYFPHVGALVALPGGMYFVEVAVRRFERARAEGRRASLRGPLIGLTLVFLAGLLAGNPEPFYFAVLLVAPYALFRLGAQWHAARGDGRARLDVLALGGKLAFAALLALGLAAIQILPFFEYLRESRVIEQRSLRQTPLEWVWWPLMMFPDVLGNPASPYKLSDNVPPPNYELVVVAYTGAGAMALAVLSLLFARRSAFTLFFALAGATWVVYAYDLFGATDLFLKIPTLDMAPMNRSQGVWNFIVACLAALCVEFAWRTEGRRRWLPVVCVFLVGLSALIACLVGADELIESYSLYSSPFRGRFLEFVPAHIRSMSVIFAASLGMLVLLWLARSFAARAVATSGLIVCSFLCTGWLFHTYNPVTENRFFFPVTPAIQTLQEKVGDQRLAILGEDMIPPSSNIPYHLEIISNYDAMWVRDYDLLFRDHFGDGNNWRPIIKGSKNSLRLFGVQYVLAKWGWNWIDSGLAGFAKNMALSPQRREILPGKDVTQTFKSRISGLRAVMVHLSTFPKQTDCDLVFRLDDLTSGKTIVTRTLSGEEIQSSVFKKRHVTWTRDFQLDPAGRPVVIRFEPQLDSRGHDYRITLSTPNGQPGRTICAWSMPVAGYDEGEAHYGTDKLAGEILFDWTCFGEPTYEPVAEIEDYVLYRFREARPRYSIVREAVVAASNTQALDSLRVPSFNPDLLVILGPATDENGGDLPIRVHAKRRIVKFEGSDYCYLVAPDGKSLAHIDDEATFVANGIDWKDIEKLPAANAAEFVFISDADREAKRRAGLILLDPKAPGREPIEVLEETPIETRLRIKNETRGYLVLDRAHFPGWRATVNGAEAPVLRANYAFSAVTLPEGDLEVRVWYEPASLRQGLWIGIGCLVMGLGSLFVGRRRRLA
ncbi:MAG: hypothetical protein JNL28_01390 [Planctomycetes bacterium]|nr:hypothetical protein [Planctomycetota bacterium]